MTQEGMFWRLVPRDVIETPAELTNEECGFVWRVKKDKMEVAMERTWTYFEWGPSALHMKGYALKEFWQKFVDDRPFHSDAINKHANVQSKAVFSYAVL